MAPSSLPIEHLSRNIVYPLVIAAAFAAIFLGMADPHPADQRAALSLQVAKHQMAQADARAGFVDAQTAQRAS